MNGDLITFQVYGDNADGSMVVKAVISELNASNAVDVYKAGYSVGRVSYRFLDHTVLIPGFIWDAAFDAWLGGEIFLTGFVDGMMSKMKFGNAEMKTFEAFVKVSKLFGKISDAAVKLAGSNAPYRNKDND